MVIRFAARIILAWRVACAFIRGGRQAVFVLLLSGGRR